jgi:AcrR family transcriptional regulator
VPRPRSLTPDQLAAAALAVIDRDGLAELTMRAVATQLGVSTMGLYRYVRDRRELEALVVELVLGTVEASPPPPGRPWRERVAEMVERVRAVAGAHPEVVPLTLTHRHSSPSLLRWSETVLEILDEAGLRGRQRAVALRGLLGYVIGAIQLEHLGPLSGTGTATMAQLPGEDFPFLADTARHARTVGPDEEFREGLGFLLRGLPGTDPEP